MAAAAAQVGTRLPLMWQEDQVAAEQAKMATAQTALREL
jgi:hypothetical protein